MAADGGLLFSGLEGESAGHGPMPAAGLLRSSWDEYGFAG